MKVLKLYDLICEKYTEEKFGLGCAIVAQWINGNVPAKYFITSFDVLQWAMAEKNENTKLILSYYHFTALSQLFGLNMQREKLYN